MTQNKKNYRALIIHPNNDYNCGDQITFLGTKALLTQALGGSEYLDVVQFDILRAERELDTYVSQYCWGKIDLIVLAGSPWLWVGLENSIKYRLLTDAIRRYPNAKYLALGIGSCFDKKVYEGIMTNVDKWFYNSNKRKEFLKYVYSRFSAIYTRDAFAQLLFEQLNIKSKLVYDTSLYSTYFIKNNSNTKRNKKVLWFYDPSKGVSSNNLSFNPNDYIEYQLDWAKDNNADIYCNTAADISSLMERGINASFSVDLIHLSKKFTEYDEMLTGRIHMGVLGFISRIPKITLLPIDTRFLTVEKLGFNIKFIGSPWKYKPSVKPNDIFKELEKEEKFIIGELKDAL